MATLAEIEKLTKDYADARNKLVDTVTTLNDKIESLKRQYLPGIKAQVSIAKERKLLLSNAVEDSPSIFVKPRTIIFHGIKVGFEKGKGKIEWSDDDQVIRLIEKHFPEQVDILIQTKKKPLKKALAQLSVAELKRLGVTVEETGDIVVIKPVDSDVDKFVEALLKDAADKEIGEAA